MTKFISIISAPGIIGKTAISINLANSIKKLDKDVILIDACHNQQQLTKTFNLHNNNPTLNEALFHNTNPKKCTFIHESGLKIIPYNKTNNNTLNEFYDQLNRVNTNLFGKSNYVINDLSSIDKDVPSSFNEHLIITNPDKESIKSTTSLINQLEKNNINIIGVILNKHEKNSSELDIIKLSQVLKYPILSIIEHDKNISDLNKHENKEFLELAEMLSE